MYGQAQAAPAAAPPMPFNAAWTPTPAPPLPPLNPAYGSPDTPYANYSPAMQPGPLTQYFYGRGGPGGPYTESGATLRPEDMADQFQNMSFGAHQH